MAIRGRVSGALAGLVVGLAAVSLVLAPEVAAAATFTATADKSQIGLLSPTTVRVTITNTTSAGGDSIGCVKVSLSANNYSLTAATVVSVSNSGSWSSSIANNDVTAKANTGGSALRPDPHDDNVVLQLSVTGKKITNAHWTVETWRDAGSSCSSQHASTNLPMKVVVAAPTPTPTPLPTPTPTPPPTPTPTPPPTPAPTPRPTPRPTPPPTQAPTPTPAPTPVGATATPDPVDTPAPSDPLASASPSASIAASPSVAPTVTPDPSGGVFGGGPIAVVPAPSGRPGRSVAQPFGPVVLGSDVSLTGIGLDALGMLGPFAVPGFIAAASSIVILLIILLQAIGAAVWLPIVRRRIGAFNVAPKRTRPRG